MTTQNGLPAEPPAAGDETATLLGSLERQRANLLWKCGELDQAGLRARLGPSAITLGGLLKHLARTEDSMFSELLLGRAPGPQWDAVDWAADPDWPWHSAAQNSPDELVDLWRAAVARSRCAVADALAAGGLEHLSVRRQGQERRSLRRILVDMIEEYARHVGHADLVRESVDGLTGWRPLTRSIGTSSSRRHQLTSELDTSDIDSWVGVPLGRSGTVEPISLNDIRRWVQAMHHPNRLYFDAEYAAASRFGQIVAPQSFTVVTEAGHGARPSTAGHVPESQMLYAGDEWWFFGPRILPGDKVTVDQMVFDYRKTTTKFAGPAVIQRGDNHYVNQRGEKIAIQRATAIRYQPKNARSNASFTGYEDEPQWDDDELARITSEKRDYVRSIIGLGHDRRALGSVSPGDELPVKVIGPHSVVSLATEWRAYIMTTWHAVYREGFVGDSGNTAEMSVDSEAAAWDPEFADGAYYGAARGHLSKKYSNHIGMPRPYGYGASMGAWVLDYLSTWAGEWGFVEHTNTQYRGPALVGDVTYLKGTVTGKSATMDPAYGKVHVDYLMTNQRAEVLSKGSGEVLLPSD